jgi:hypothetical protein
LGAVLAGAGTVKHGTRFAHTAQHQLARGNGAADVGQAVYLRGVVLVFGLLDRKSVV